MYNGIGLLTPRGSGTSGYVQANKFNLRRAPHSADESNKKKLEDGPKEKQPNMEIILHNKKREIEVKLYELRMTLEDEGVPDEQVEAQVAAERTNLERDLLAHEEAPSSFQEKGAQETHETAKRKIQQMDRLRDALGLGDVKEGEAFDRELQEKRREERAAAKEEMERERRKRFKEEKAARLDGKASGGRSREGGGDRRGGGSSRRWSRSRSRSRSRSPSQRSRDRDERRSEREEGKDMVRRMDRKRMPPESEAKQRAADGAPSAEAGDRRVSHEQLHTQHDSQDGEGHAMKPGYVDKQIDTTQEKPMDAGVSVVSEGPNQSRRPHRSQPRGWENQSNDQSGFPTEGRLAGRLQVGGERRREGWRPGGSDWRGRGRFGRYGQGTGHGRGGRDGHGQWSGRWYDRGRGLRGRGRNWVSSQNNPHPPPTESGGYFRKDEVAPERYNPAGDLPEDLAFVNNRPPNWDQVGRWPKSEDLEEEEGKSTENMGDGVAIVEKAIVAGQEPHTKKSHQGLSQSPSPHSCMTLKRSPSQPRSRRRPKDYRSECPSPTTEESIEGWQNGNTMQLDKKDADHLPGKENGSIVHSPGPEHNSRKIDTIADSTEPVGVNLVVSTVTVPSTILDASPKVLSRKAELLQPDSPAPSRDRVFREMDAPQLQQESETPRSKIRSEGGDADVAAVETKKVATGEQAGPQSPDKSPTRLQPLPAPQVSGSRSKSRQASESRSPSRSRSPKSHSQSHSRSQSRSRTRSRSRSSSRSVKSDASKSSHSRQHRQRQNWKERRYHYDDRRGRDHRPERGRHFAPRGRFDSSRYRNGPPGPSWARNGGGGRGRFGQGQFRRYNSGPRYGGGSRYMRDRPGWNRPGDRRGMARYGDREKTHDRRSRSRERPRRTRNESPDHSPRRHRSSSRSKSPSSRGTSPSRKIHKQGVSPSSGSASPKRRRSFSPKRTRR